MKDKSISYFFKSCSDVVIDIFFVSIILINKIKQNVLGVDFVQIEDVLMRLAFVI